ncbi:hypothetical protein [uncultured Paraglaciecola sp.]|uniref:hypothetical protein n=1 Tax=uncultured Paraglaciecola sp. TaxID=1765024 RepID=UPI00262DD350|nr:hypothetical protein [uncultured Paraglaciecola sp.]
MRAIKAKEAGADIFVVSYEKLFDSSLHDTKNILSKYDFLFRYGFKWFNTYMP